MTTQCLADSGAGAKQTTDAVEFPIELEDAGAPAGERAVHLRGRGKMRIEDALIHLRVRGENPATALFVWASLSIVLYLLMPWLESQPGFDGATMQMLFSLVPVVCGVLTLFERQTFTVDPRNHRIMLDQQRRRFYMEVGSGLWVCGVTGIRRIDPMTQVLRARFGDAIEFQLIPYWILARMQRWAAILCLALFLLAAGLAAPAVRDSIYG